MTRTETDHDPRIMSPSEKIERGWEREARTLEAKLWNANTDLTRLRSAARELLAAQSAYDRKMFDPYSRVESRSELKERLTGARRAAQEALGCEDAA